MPPFCALGAPVFGPNVRTQQNLFNICSLNTALAVQISIDVNLSSSRMQVIIGDSKSLVASLFPVHIQG